LAIHELSHDLFMPTALGNKLFGYVANLPLIFPVSATFNRYHNAHHAGLNTDGVDADLPTEFEFRMFNQSRLGRLVWVFLQPLMYGLRPLFEKPKSPNKWQIWNLLIQLVYSATIYYFSGFYGLIYLMAGTALGIGLHPISGHFIAEHYEIFKGQETSSYYGPGNWITYNVGYHVEHHDLPKIPGRLLPKLKRMAPEFYDNLNHHTSWIAVVYNFVMYGSLKNRIRRTRPELSLNHSTK
jgi:sphingolipid delta-4 desaturase